jgi:hypothetical protein
MFFYSNRKEFYPGLPLFSEDASNALGEGYTVTYNAIQIAVYMGFKEIYLLGVDHSYAVNLKADNTVEKKETKSYSDILSDGIDKVDNLPRIDYSTLAYTAAEKYAREHDIKIYNATRGGALEIFPRVDFDSLF